MDNINNRTIKINETISDCLTNDVYRHVYDIYLEKNKYYFITLISKDDTEFNLRIYDNEKNITNDFIILFILIFNIPNNNKSYYCKYQSTYS